MKIPVLKVLKYSSRLSLLVSLGGLIVIFGGVSAYAAHSDALPGSTLYPFKQAWQEGQIFLSLSPASKAQTQVNIAKDNVKSAQSVVSQTPAATNGSNAIEALQQAQEHLQAAQTQAEKISDNAKKKEIEKSISDTATETENEVSHESETESSNSTDKQNLQNTSDQVRQIQNQASGDD